MTIINSIKSDQLPTNNIITIDILDFYDKISDDDCYILYKRFWKLEFIPGISQDQKNRIKHISRKFLHLDKTINIIMKSFEYKKGCYGPDFIPEPAFQNISQETRQACEKYLMALDNKNNNIYVLF